MTFQPKLSLTFSAILSALVLTACQPQQQDVEDKDIPVQKHSGDKNSVKSGLSDPLVEHIYTADPSAHVFNGRLYIYPSHDVESGIPQNDNGDHFDMRDYHILSMDEVGGEVTDHGVALSVKERRREGDVKYTNGH